MSRPASVVLSTTLDPVARAAIDVLADLESARGSANVLLERLVRAELERVRPGLWDELAAARAQLPKGLTPREQSDALVKVAKSSHCQRHASAMPPT